MQAEIDSRRPRPTGSPKAPSRRDGMPAHGRRPPPPPSLDVFEAKIRPPTPRQGIVARPARMNTALRASTRSGAVSTRVPSRSKTTVSIRFRLCWLEEHG